MKSVDEVSERELAKAMETIADNSSDEDFDPTALDETESTHDECSHGESDDEEFCEGFAGEMGAADE